MKLIKREKVVSLKSNNLQFINSFQLQSPIKFNILIAILLNYLFKSPIETFSKERARVIFITRWQSFLNNNFYSIIFVFSWNSLNYTLFISTIIFISNDRMRWERSMEFEFVINNYASNLRWFISFKNLDYIPSNPMPHSTGVRA